MIKAAADVTAGREPHHYVGRELPVGPVIVMRGINYLLHRRPYIIGELRCLDYYPDVVAESREPVGGPHNKVFRDRSVKNPATAKLFLHSFGDVEYAALFF